MDIFKRRLPHASLIFTGLFAIALGTLAEENLLPQFGRDTVLVWKIRNQNFEANFVVRIAEFSPDRYLEWEDAQTQGTIFMPFRDIQAAKGFASANLFESGVDARGKNTTTLWISRRIYRGLKEKKKVKCALDGVGGALKYLGDDHLTVEINRSPRELPVIRVSDDRGSERWFLDQEENPLMVRHFIRQFDQTLASITTDRPNMLRWIKGKKLMNLPH